MASPLISWQEIIETIRVMPEIRCVSEAQNPTMPMEDGVFQTSTGAFFANIAAIQESEMPHFNRVRVAVFASDFQEDDAYLEKVVSGTAPLNRLCFLLDAELRLYELGREDKTQTVSEQEFLKALAYGMMSVEPGMDSLVIVENGHNHDFCAQQIITMLNEDSPEDGHILQALCMIGDLSIAAMMGAMIAARMARIPVFLDSQSGWAAAALLCHYRSDAAQHCIAMGDKRNDGCDSDAMRLLSGDDLILPLNNAVSGYTAILKLLHLKAVCQCLPQRKGVHVHMAVGERNA